MDIEDVSCPNCDRMFTGAGDTIPRLIPDNGLCYCTMCIQTMLNQSVGQDHFFCPEDPDTPIKRMDSADSFMKNIQMIRMADRFRKKQQEQQSSAQKVPAAQPQQDAGNNRFQNRSSTFVRKGPSNIAEAGPAINTSTSMPGGGAMAQQQPQHDICPIYGKPLDVICITCKERICSQAALFGPCKGHDVRPDQEVFDQINLRTECLMEIYQMMETAASEKPNEMEVNSLTLNFKKKSDELKKKLKEKFKEMRNILVVQEQTTEAILVKNLQYIEKELKNLQSVDYRKFEEAESWLKNAKVKLDNFQANQNNPNYIAFEMMIGADNGQAQNNMNDDFLLVEDANKNNDIIDHGEAIAGNIGKFKCIQPGILAGQLNQLQLIFKEDVVKNLHSISKCETIEGVQISQEELEAWKDEAMLKQEAEDGFGNAASALEDGSSLPMDISVGGSSTKQGSKKKPLGKPDPRESAANKKNAIMMGAMSSLQSVDQMNILQGINNNEPIPGTDMGGQQLQTQSSSIAEPTIQPQGLPQMLDNITAQMQQMNVGQTEEPSPGEELDPDFLLEIETYLKECMENNELSIDMSDTHIQDHGAKMVAAAASLCDHLQELRLQQCGISDEGAIEIFNELKILKTLQVIDISFNPITERSLDALSELLNINQNLVVNMRMNNIKSRFAARKMQFFEQQGRLDISNG